MKAISERLADFFLAAAKPIPLAILRILVGAYTLHYLTDHFSMLIGIANADESLFDPVGVAAFLGSPWPAFVFEEILVTTIAFNIAFVLGWGFRLSGPVFASLLLFVLCYRNSWSMIYHSQNLLVLQVVILGFTRSADVLSTDRLARWCYAQWKVRGNDGLPAAAPAVHWRYGWPIRLMCVVTTLCYFLAGVAKVAGPLGWSWANGEAFRSQLAADALRKELLGDGASSLFFQLFDQLWLFFLFGMATLVLELGAPLTLLNKRVASYWALGVWLFHWGVFVVMDIKFHYMLSGIAFVPFIATRLNPKTKTD